MDYWGAIELIYDEETIDHITKHNVTIDEVLYVIKHSKKIATRLKGNHYAIIGETHGRCLVIIVTKLRGNTYILRTARDCSEKEKKLYAKKCKK